MNFTDCFSLSETLMGTSARGAILQSMKMEYTGNTVRFHPAEVRAQCSFFRPASQLSRDWQLYNSG